MNYLIDYSSDFLAHDRVMCNYTSSEMEIDELTEISCGQFKTGKKLLERLASSKPQIELEIREKLAYMRDEWIGHCFTIHDECRVTVSVYKQDTLNAVPIWDGESVIFSVTTDEDEQ